MNFDRPVSETEEILKSHLDETPAWSAERKQELWSRIQSQIQQEQEESSLSRSSWRHLMAASLLVVGMWGLTQSLLRQYPEVDNAFAFFSAENGVERSEVYFKSDFDYFLESAEF